MSTSSGFGVLVQARPTQEFADRNLPARRPLRQLVARWLVLLTQRAAATGVSIRL